MPPLARSLGLMLVLTAPVCLVAAPYAPGRDVPLPRGTQGGPAGRPRQEQPVGWPPRTNPDWRGGAVPAVYESDVSVSAAPADFGFDGPPTPQTESRQLAGASTGESPALPDRSSPLALPRRGGSSQAGAARRMSGLPSVVTIASSLALVLGLFLVVAWVMRRAVPGGATTLPGEVVEVLGRKVVAGRQQLQLLRCGNKLLLVSVTPAGVEPLTEITDQDEVNHLAALCRRAQPGSATAVFRDVLEQFSGRPREGSDV